ncbi:hypothetical protein [Brevundimonas sp.]|uniref:hypothetical protein n=1 Tax=Brevundimonas sp. TaxID=1871086 RepID=UPI0035B22235
MTRVRLTLTVIAGVGLMAGPVLAQQGPTPYAEASGGAELYAPPPVRPFEAPSDFGLEADQGDAEWTGPRPPLIIPVAVGDYRSQYEHPPASADVAYDQAVAEHELRADGMMGSLDGRWLASDASGRAVMELDLRDPGDGPRIEGAWRDLTAPAATPGRTGVVLGVRAVDGAVRAGLEDGAALSIRRGVDGVTARLERDGAETPLTLRPAG